MKELNNHDKSRIFSSAIIKISALLIMCSLCQTGFSQKEENYRFIEIGAGYGFGTDIIIYAGQLAVEIKSSKRKTVSYNFEYNFSKSNGGFTINNPGSSSSYSIVVINKNWFTNVFWHPIRTMNQPFSWLILGAGLGYSEQKFGDYLDNHGPAIQGTIGIQYEFFDKITLSAKTQLYYMYNENMNDPARIKFTGMPLRISIGYRFK